MAAPTEPVVRCARCPKPATTTAEIRARGRVFELMLCERHRRELLRGARRLRA
jgi:hypothetical protein